MIRVGLFISVSVLLIGGTTAVQGSNKLIGQRSRRAITRPHQSFTLTCKNKAAISFLQSLYSANHQDRLWGGRCDAPLPANITHVWTTFANVFKGNMSFVCPFGGVVTGMGSLHNTFHQDRRYKFRCALVGCKIRFCLWTVFSKLRLHWRFQVPAGYYISGMKSIAHSSVGDRYFSLQVCKYALCSQQG